MKIELDRLSKKGVLSLTKTKNISLIVKNKVGSTNEIVKDYARHGKNEGIILIAKSQVKGRGRFERKFYSPKNSGIYMSFLLKPSLKAYDSVLITACAAVAVSIATEKLSNKEAKIKWVNDVYLNQKKVCGILTEGSVNSQKDNFDWVVLGIGINVYTPKEDFNSEIKNIAGSVFEREEKNLKNRFCALVIDEFFKYYNTLETKSFFAEYEKRIMYIGEQVNVIKSGETLPAKVLSVNQDCSLSVEYEDKTTENLCSGEISIKLIN